MIPIRWTLYSLRKSLQGTQQWSQGQAADKSLSLFSQQELKCQCLVLARPSTELTAPSDGGCSEGADVTRYPAELKMGQGTSVSLEIPLPPHL